MDASNYRYDLFLYPCPPGYCKCSQNTSLGPSSCAFTYTNSDPDAQCVCDRQGTFCVYCILGALISLISTDGRNPLWRVSRWERCQCPAQ